MLCRTQGLAPEPHPYINLQVVYIQNMAAREPRYCTTSQPLAPSTLAALSARGIDQLFIHQASAVDALCSKQKHVVIATSTASGKSLCYNIPMLEAVAQDPQVRKAILSCPCSYDP